MYLFQCVKSRCPRVGYTRCLLEEYGGRITVELLIGWLDEIGNLPARDALRREYDSMNILLRFNL